MTHAGNASRSFGSVAAAYLRYRPDYPDALWAALIDAVGEPRARAVDLGAGTGQASRALASRFAGVVAVEPDPRMAAAIAPDARIAVVNASAEDVAFEPGSVDAVVAATAFHWMDQRRVVERVFAWLRPGGVFFPFLYGPFAVKGAAEAVFRAHRRRWSAYKDKRLGAAADYSRAIAASGLFPNRRTWSGAIDLDRDPESAAGLFMTASYARAYALDHAGIDAYAAELERDLAAAGPRVQVRLPLGGVICVKAAD